MLADIRENAAALFPSASLVVAEIFFTHKEREFVGDFLIDAPPGLLDPGRRQANALCNLLVRQVFKRQCYLRRLRQRNLRSVFASLPLSFHDVHELRSAPLHRGARSL